MSSTSRPVEAIDLPESKKSLQTPTSHPPDLSTVPSLNNHVSFPRELLVVGLISVTQFTNQVGFAGTLPILHLVGAHYHLPPTSGALTWLVASYSLSVGTFILVFGRLGDRFGWKRLLVVGYAWFALWTLVVGLAWFSDHVLFVFARALQGLGPAIAMPNGLALLGALYRPGKRKNMAFAVFGAAAPVGAIVGSLGGSLFALAWWPWVYWSFSIALACCGVVAAAVIPDPQGDKPGIRGASTFADAVAALDAVGAVIGVTGLVCFNFAWNQAPIVGWQSAYVIVTMILGVLLIVGFVLYEVKVARDPLLPRDVFSSNNAFMLACIVCGWSSFGIWVYYLYQILEVIEGISPILASVYFIPLLVVGALAATTTGWLLGRARPAWVMIIAMAAFLTGTILVATLPLHQIYWAQTFVTIIIMPFGMDMSFPAGTLVISNSVRKEHQGVAASLVNTVVNYSISLGLGFAGTVEVNVNNGGKTKADLFDGYRGALYMGVGLAGLGLAIAIVFLLKSYRDDYRLGHADVPKSKQTVDAV